MTSGTRSPNRVSPFRECCSQPPEESEPQPLPRSNLGDRLLPSGSTWSSRMSPNPRLGSSCGGATRGEPGAPAQALSRDPAGPTVSPVPSGSLPAAPPPKSGPLGRMLRKASGPESQPESKLEPGLLPGHPRVMEEVAWEVQGLLSPGTAKRARSHKPRTAGSAPI